MINFQSVSKRYKKNHLALNNISFQIATGEIAFLTGHSGAGKSTLLRLLMLMDRPTSGQITINGNAWSTLPNRKIPEVRRHIGMVHQSNMLLGNRSVFDNIALPLQICGYDKKSIKYRVDAAIDKVKLSGKSDYFTSELSLGEQQRVGIARAVINRPRILIADEPTGNLDPKLSEDVMDLFQEFSEAGVSVLIASHDKDLISRYRQRVIILRQGEMIYDTAASPAPSASQEKTIDNASDNGVSAQ